MDKILKAKLDYYRSNRLRIAEFKQKLELLDYVYMHNYIYELGDDFEEFEICFNDIFPEFEFSGSILN